MKYKKETIVNPDHKVGIKILNDTQMLNVFPDYENTINRIEAHRKWLIEHEIQRLENYQYNLMYDNVISIFGKRGTGKTSVAFTLHKKIEEDREHPYDIVLPIIIPEVIPDDGSVLGWLLAIVNDQVEEFEKEYQKIIGGQDFETERDRFWDNCKAGKMRGIYSSLSEKLARLVELFYSAKYNPANELSYNIAIGNSVRQSQNYYEFAKTIMEFWDHWIATIKKSNKMQGNTQEEIAPLIYFMFDDVDLAPQKVDELLSIIIKYLSHPNIIVITTADEEMFLEVIEERLDRDIGRLPKEWRSYLRSQDISKNGLAGDDESGELIRKTSRRYLGKVMPTSTRYYLKQFNTVEEKRLFYLDDNKELWEGICEQVKRLLLYIPRHAKRRENFLTENQVDRDYYLNFLGNTSRQLGNAYIGIKDFISSLIQNIVFVNDKTPHQQRLRWKKYVETVYNNAWRFIYISINSNHDLAERIEDVEGFINEVFWLEHNGWLLYINYAYLDDYLRRKLERVSRVERIRIAFQLYSLFQFTENIFVILESCTENGITGRQRIHGLSTFRDFLCDQVFHGEAKLQRNLTAIDFFAHYRILLNRIERLMEEGTQDEKLCKEYFFDLKEILDNVPDNFIYESFRKDRDWLQEICGMLSAVYGNLYLIGRRELKNCSLYEEWETMFGYQTAIKYILEEDVYQTLDKFNLFSTAKTEIRIQRRILKQTWSEVENSEEETEKLKLKFETGIYQMILEQAEKVKIADENSEIDMDEMENTEDLDMCTVAAVVKMVNTELMDETIGFVVRLLPDEEAQEIENKLRQDFNGSGMLALLKMLYNSIAEWDLSVQTGYVSNLMNVLAAIHEREIEMVYRKELDKLADHIKISMPDGYEEQEKLWYFGGGVLYRRIKEHLNRVKYACRRDKITYINELTNKIEKEFDAAVQLDDIDEFENAFYLAVRAHLAMRIQRLYLYHSVVEKYNSNSDYSSDEVTYRGRSVNGNKERNYYYQLFSQMEELVETDFNRLSKEQKMVRNLIERGASQNRKVYIRSILHEVKYEPFTD